MLLTLPVLAMLLACQDEDMEPILPAESAYSTGLPVVAIDTDGRREVDSKDNWRQATMRIFGPDGGLVVTTRLAVRGRGNVTWSKYPKKPYTLKLDGDVSLLGMAPSRRWTLQANYCDRTLLRNDVVFEMARRVGMEWVPRGRFVELVLNGVYQGNYYLCEKIQVSPRHLPIAEMDEKDSDVSGGYLMEIDKYFDEERRFRSSVMKLPYQFRYPDVEHLTDAQFQYMERFVNDLERSLSDATATERGDYRQWVDEDSWIRWWLVNELCRNKETGVPRSVYVYKDRGGKLKAGPVWDYDWSTFMLYDNIYVAHAFPYLRWMFRNRAFKQKAAERWRELRDTLVNLTEYIDRQASYISESAERNTMLWPLRDFKNGDERLTFDDAVGRMKEAYLMRIQCVDDFLNE